MYEFTAFYLYKSIFMVELLVAELLMCIGLKRRPLFALRYSLCCAGCIGIAFAIPVAAYNALYCSFVFMLMFAVSLSTLKICYELNWVSVVFRGVAAYTTQHIAYQTFDLGMMTLSLAFGQDVFTGGAYGSGSVSEYLPVIMYRAGAQSLASESPMRYELLTLFGYCLYGIVYLLLYILSYRFVSSRLKSSDKFELKNSSMFVFVVLFVLFNVIITSVVTYYTGGSANVLYTYLLSFYNITCCLFTFYLMFEVIFKKQLERGYTIANRLLKQAEEQYALAKENIELINLKCHDLKHQIREIGNASVGKDAIKEIEKMISIYDAGIRTGNEALDIILTEKSLYCNNRNIKLYCIADGSLLKFMSDPDLYSLFGNLLDNAIEAVEHLSEEKRFINLLVRSVNGFTQVNTSNCLSRELDFSDGLPSTTKSDKDSHGYGMKSIRLICRKYDGEFEIKTTGGMFEVNIIFMR